MIGPFDALFRTSVAVVVAAANQQMSFSYVAHNHARARTTHAERSSQHRLSALNENMRSLIMWAALMVKGAMGAVAPSLELSWCGAKAWLEFEMDSMVWIHAEC